VRNIRNPQKVSIGTVTRMIPAIRESKECLLKEKKIPHMPISTSKSKNRRSFGDIFVDLIFASLDILKLSVEHVFCKP
jgi:hypothetical protein